MSTSPVNENSVVFVEFANAANGFSISPAWIDKCQKEHGKPVNNLANVLIALRGDKLLCSAIAWDEMQQTTFLVAPIDGSTSTTFVPRPLTDCDVSRIQETLRAIVKFW